MVSKTDSVYAEYATNVYLPQSFLFEIVVLVVLADLLGQVHRTTRHRKRVTNTIVVVAVRSCATLVPLTAFQFLPLV